MATGHTHPVVEGKINNVSDFAFECSKSFVYSWRNSNQLAYPSLKDDDYYDKALADEFVKLSEWDTLDEAGRYAKWSDYATQQMQSIEEGRTRAETAFFRLEGLLTAVKQAEVPETHANFKQFMIDQLTDTIKHDGTFNESWFVVETYPDWADNQRVLMLERIERYSKLLRENEQRIIESRQWISTLANLFDLKVVDPDESA